MLLVLLGSRRVFLRVGTCGDWIEKLGSPQLRLLLLSQLGRLSWYPIVLSCVFVFVVLYYTLCSLTPLRNPFCFRRCIQLLTDHACKYESREDSRTIHGKGIKIDWCTHEVDFAI